MLLSMTGFASQMVTIALKAGGEALLNIEIKSLNTRFFEATCRLPNGLNHLEISIINMLKQKLVRGRVFLNVRMAGDSIALESVSPAFGVAKEYYQAAQAIQKKVGVEGKLTISDLVRFPNIFAVDQIKLDKKDERKIIDAIAHAADALVQERTREGQHHLLDLEKRFSNCATYMDQIKDLFKAFMKQQKEEIKRTLASSKDGDQEAEAQLDDLYSMLNKIDIHEEITRFKSHLKGVKKLLSTAQLEKGRHLDFMLQELGRETNTITAKCSSFQISSVAVEIKVELEKAREQVQNVV